MKTIIKKSSYKFYMQLDIFLHYGFSTANKSRLLSHFIGFLNLL